MCKKFIFLSTLIKERVVIYIHTTIQEFSVTINIVWSIYFPFCSFHGIRILTILIVITLILHFHTRTSVKFSIFHLYKVDINSMTRKHILAKWIATIHNICCNKSCHQTNEYFAIYLELISYLVRYVIILTYWRAEYFYSLRNITNGI